MLLYYLYLDKKSNILSIILKKMILIYNLYILIYILMFLNVFNNMKDLQENIKI